MNLELEITDATQYATLYRDGRPIATLQRRRVYDTGPRWRAFDTDGREVARFYSANSAAYLARATVRAMERQRAAVRRAYEAQKVQP